MGKKQIVYEKEFLSKLLFFVPSIGIPIILLLLTLFVIFTSKFSPILITFLIIVSILIAMQSYKDINNYYLKISIIDNQLCFHYLKKVDKIKPDDIDVIISKENGVEIRLKGNIGKNKIWIGTAYNSKKSHDNLLLKLQEFKAT